MGQKIVVVPTNKGLKKDVTPFNVDNDSFPVLINAYQWRGRIKRKRGTSLLGRLVRAYDSTELEYNQGSSTITLTTEGDVNILTSFNLESGGALVPSTVIITDTTTSTVYTDNGTGGFTPVSGTLTIDYATGILYYSSGYYTHVISVAFSYYPQLPVMGLRDFNPTSSQFPQKIGFDTTYSYKISTSFPYTIYDVSWYKNPLTSGGYTQRTHPSFTTWNGQDYQQFWTVNYQGALWATNGLNVPFDASQFGMQYKVISAITYVGNVATITFSSNHGLFVGDFLFINEVLGITGINFQTGYVTVNVNPTQVKVTFPDATLGGSYTSGGIAQYLTNRSDYNVDCIRWYDGDPTTDGDPTLSTGKGWVNFMPPLSIQDFSISDLPPAIYYLVGAKMIIPFKDRLLFLGPVVQTSAAGSQVYLPDTIVYSRNGTPYYTCSYTNSPTAGVDNPISATNEYTPLLVPNNQTAVPNSWFEDTTGFGGYISAGISQPIITAAPNEDVLIIGFSNIQARLIYSGNDIVPFTFYQINSELGSASTFSAVIMDQGIISRGNRGFIITSQQEAQRIDLDIPDEVFQINITNNGNERFTAIRDYINEWIYFTYPSNDETVFYPDQTLLYNYRSNSWALFKESYTTYGQFTPNTGSYTWATIGSVYSTWSEWNDPWNSGTTTALQTRVIAGNQQGFIVFRDVGTGEANSLSITTVTITRYIDTITKSNPCEITVSFGNDFVVGQQIYISGILGMTQLNGVTAIITAVTPLDPVTTTLTINVDSSSYTTYISGGTVEPLENIYSPNHGLNEGDFIIINNCISSIDNLLNGVIYQVSTVTENGFTTYPLISNDPFLVIDYVGSGTITRLYIPFIQTRQFPVSWEMGRKTRIGTQQYLLSKTDKSQITLYIYLSQDADNPYNFGTVVPEQEPENSSLVYSTVLYTCPESTNLGLTPANTNLQMPTASTQQQIWHRINTSLIGDTVQLGFTISEDQMFSVDENGVPINATAEVELHGFILDVTPSMLLS